MSQIPTVFHKDPVVEQAISITKNKLLDGYSKSDAIGFASDNLTKEQIKEVENYFLKRKY